MSCDFALFIFFLNLNASVFIYFYKIIINSFFILQLLLLLCLFLSVLSVFILNVYYSDSLRIFEKSLLLLFNVARNIKFIIFILYFNSVLI